jgi:putative spermidine/putrescine transport system ATP-binding protein
VSDLTLDNLVKRYDNRSAAAAVANVSLRIAKGEFMTFLGPSGSGKTTTLMMIAGFERPTSGTISIGGRPIDPIPPHRRNIGVVFQNYALFPHMSVTKNIAYPLRMRRRPRDEIRTRVERILDVVGLSAFSASEPRHLSGGQQQRVALARALVFEPDVLLLDEPLGALDKNLREQMQIELRRIHRELHVTTIYVTHDQTEAMTMSDRIAVFNAGGIEQVDTPLNVYQRPRTRFVAGFVGDNNVLSATAAAPSRGDFAVDGLGKITGMPTGIASDTRVWLAIRPENIRLADSSTPDINRFSFKISGSLNFGDSVLLHGSINDQPLKVRLTATEASRFQDGMEMPIHWAPQSTHAIASG